MLAVQGCAQWVLHMFLLLACLFITFLLPLDGHVDVGESAASTATYITTRHEGRARA